MAKLYPPQLEGTIPAFYAENGTAFLTIPFAMNQAVSKSDISAIAVKIKSILNSEVLTTQETTNIDYQNNVLTINLENYQDFLTVGQFYKVQIAYVHKEKDETISETGYYSTVAITKFTAKPTVSLAGDYKPGKLYSAAYAYTGEYKQKDMISVDSTEKVYSYEFVIYDENGNLYLSSGEKLHNHENDTEGNISTDTWELTEALPEDQIFTLYYKVKTSNGLEESSSGYKIYTGETVEPTVAVKVIAETDNENGLAIVSLETEKEEEATTLNGTFILSRTKDSKAWEQVQKYRFIDKPITQFKFIDYTIEHGYTYQYGLQQINTNTGLTSTRIKSNKVIAEFEDLYLFDGERQLKVKFNPKVSSFKQSVLESKTNSIGSKYPYYFRNAHVSFKEFSISGLVSYLADENQMFLTDADLQLDDYSSFKREITLNPSINENSDEYFSNLGDLGLAYQLKARYAARDEEGSEYSLIKGQRGRSTSLEHYNILAERIFKLEVLNFINSGKPMLFRSPAEGNYIVRLMSSSMTPNDQLGRMLYTFTTSASEFADCNTSNLKKYGFLPTKEESYLMKRVQVGTIKPPDAEVMINAAGTWTANLLPNDIQAYKIQCADMFLGDKILINEKTEIEIGSTGILDLETDETINSIKILQPVSSQALIYYYYWSEPTDEFSKYESITIEDVPCVQLRATEGSINFNNKLNINNESVLKYQRIYIQTIEDPEKLSSIEAVKLYFTDGSTTDVSIINTGELYFRDASFIKNITLPEGTMANITYQKKVVKLIEEETTDETELSS